MLDHAQLVALSLPENRRSHTMDVGELYEAESHCWVSTEGGAVQTVMNLNDPSAIVLENHRAMMLAALLVPRIEQVLDLGMGGGAFVRYLNRFEAGAKITAVELEPSMVAVAREHLALPSDQAVHIGDAIDFVYQTRQGYDLVLCDVFAGKQAPTALLDLAFYRRLMGLLNHGGAIAINTLPSSEDEVARMLKAMSAHFAGVGLLQFSALGNVVIWLQCKALPERNDLLTRAEHATGCDEVEVSAVLDRLIRV